MIEVTGIRIPLSSLDGSTERELEVVRAAALRGLGLSPANVASFELRKRSIDARKKSDISLLFTARLALAGGTSAERMLGAENPPSASAGHGSRNLERSAAHSGRAGKYRGARGRNGRLGTHGGTLLRAKLVDETLYEPPRFEGPQPDERPLVVGAGCAGLFCALALAEAGLCPILIERGDDCSRRTQYIARLNSTGELDPESNIQFGLGGAGAFSDGKLGTGTKSLAHRWILQALVECGASPNILWDAKPHVGSDVLPAVVEALVTRIEAAGGQVRCRTRMTSIELSGKRVRAIEVETRDEESGLLLTERIACSQLVLACGHSARDVFELLRSVDVSLERKTFAMGVRIEHRQADIDRAQYGRSAGHPALGAAPYKLASHLDDGRGVFSFCMCPGGYVVAAASEPEGVVTNGMSLSDRAGFNANAGLLANVFPSDLPGDDVLAGIELQRACERAAYEAGGGAFVAPAQLVGDFLSGVPSSGGTKRVDPTYPRGVAWGTIDGCLPSYVTEALRFALPKLERSLHGFAASDAVLTGVETRSSAPVRVTRGQNGQALGVEGLFPCGEGAGYAGGIMSAATDGLRAASWVMEALEG